MIQQYNECQCSGMEEMQSNFLCLVAFYRTGYVKCRFPLCKNNGTTYKLHILSQEELFEFTPIFKTAVSYIPIRSLHPLLD